jgi:hypothetical protein
MTAFATTKKSQFSRRKSKLHGNLAGFHLKKGAKKLHGNLARFHLKKGAKKNGHKLRYFPCTLNKPVDMLLRV